MSEKGLGMPVRRVQTKPRATIRPRRSWNEFLKKPPDTMKLALVAVAFGVVIMTVPGLFGIKSGGSSSGKTPAGATPVAALPGAGRESEIEQMQQRMSRDIETALSRIQGAGKVHVTVTLKTGVIRDPVINRNRQETTTGEKAADDSQRDQKTVTLAETHVVVQDTLAVVKELRPQIAGVLVVADGAYDARIREQLTKAVSSLGIPLHLVQVDPADRGRS